MKIKSRPAYYARQKHLFVTVVILVSVLPLLIISWTSSYYYQASWLRKTSTELKSLADSRREIIDLFLENQENLLAGFAELYDLDTLSRKANLEMIFTAINRSGVITDLGVIDRQGNHIAYVGPYHQQLTGKNYAGSEWFKEVIRNGRYISDVFSGYRNVPHFVVAVTSPDKTWLLRATINSELFNALLASAEVGPGGDAYIVNQKGEAQTPSRLGSPEIPGSLIAESALPHEPVVKQQDGFIYVTTGMKGGDWFLVLKTQIRTSLVEYYRARNRDIFIIGCSALLILFVATLLVRSMVGKLEKADQQRMGLNDRIRQSEKMALIGRLAASVAHEINNPLQIIGDQAGWLGELLDEENQTSLNNLGEYRQAIQKIRTHVKRASSITHKLLGFSRSNDNTRTATDLNRLTDDAISFLENEAKNHQITIRRDLQPDLPQVTTDAAQLQQVFLNILNNAIDAIGQDGAITVSSKANDRIVIEFADSGPGLPAGDPKKIFDPFFTTKNQGKGTGLGLSISYNIMQRLGGNIEARNGRQGGSVFSITLPVT